MLCQQYRILGRLTGDHCAVKSDAFSPKHFAKQCAHVTRRIDHINGIMALVVRGKSPAFDIDHICRMFPASLHFERVAAEAVTVIHSHAVIDNFHKRGVRRQLILQTVAGMLPRFHGNFHTIIIDGKRGNLRPIPIGSIVPHPPVSPKEIIHIAVVADQITVNSPDAL